MTSGKPTWCNGSTLARNARDVGNRNIYIYEELFSKTIQAKFDWYLPKYHRFPAGRRGAPLVLNSAVPQFGIYIYI